MWSVRLLSHDAQESPLTFKRPSYLGSAWEAQDQVRGTWQGGIRLGMTQAQPPCPAPSRDSPKGKCCGGARHRSQRLPEVDTVVRPPLVVYHQRRA